MSERVTDEWLDQRIAVLGDSPSDRQERLVLLELQQHRARIAAHAATHPERLSEEDIERWIAQVGGADRSGLRASPRETGRDLAIYLAMLEIQQHRAAALGPDDVAELARLREYLDTGYRAQFRVVIDKILAAHGARP